MSESVTEKRLKILQEEINMLQLEERELQLRLTVVRKKQNKKMGEVKRYKEYGVIIGEYGIGLPSANTRPTHAVVEKQAVTDRDEIIKELEEALQRIQNPKYYTRESNIADDALAKLEKWRQN